jgi:hypothetical protein
MAHQVKYSGDNTLFACCPEWPLFTSAVTSKPSQLLSFFFCHSEAEESGLSVFWFQMSRLLTGRQGFDMTKGRTLLTKSIFSDIYNLFLSQQFAGNSRRYRT